MKHKVLRYTYLTVIALLLLCGLPVKGSTARAEDEQPPEQVRKDWVIDLTGGYYHFDPMWEASWFVKEWVDCETFPDLDGDGTEDILFSQYTVRSYGFIDELVAVPLPGGSINGAVTLKGTEDAPFASITFRLNNSKVKPEYKIQIKGGWAETEYYDEESETFVKKTVTSAAPGTVIKIKADPLKGKYVNEWKASGISISGPKQDDDTQPYLGTFVMPAHDVSASPVTLNQKPYVLELERGALGEGLTVYNIGAVEGLSEPFKDATDGLIDLDGDGLYDLLCEGWKSTMAYAAPALHSTGREYKIEALNSGPNYPITIRYPEDAYTLDLSEGVILGDYLNKDMLKKLRNNLKAYESTERRDYFDIDNDGQPDVRMAPDDSMLVVLESYSLGESFLIPASTGGINHSVTLLCKKAPEYYSLELNSGEGGNVTVYEQAQFTAAFKIDYINPDVVVMKGYRAEGESENITVLNEYESMEALFMTAPGNRFLKGTAVYLMIKPDEGYHLKSVTCNGKEYGEEFGSCILSMTANVSVKVVFEQDTVPTPTPTPVPTPAPNEITGEAGPTEVPADLQDGVSGVPTQAPSDTQKSEKDNNLLIWVIVAGIVLTGLIAAVIITKKKESKSTD